MNDKKIKDGVLGESVLDDTSIITESTCILTNTKSTQPMEKIADTNLVKIYGLYPHPVTFIQPNIKEIKLSSGVDLKLLPNTIFVTEEINIHDNNLEPIFRIAGGIHSMNGEIIFNISVLNSNYGYILIDPNYDQNEINEYLKSEFKYLDIENNIAMFKKKRNEKGDVIDIDKNSYMIISQHKIALFGYVLNTPKITII